MTKKQQGGEESRSVPGSGRARRRLRKHGVGVLVCAVLLTGLFGVQRTAAQTYNDDGTKLIWSATMTVGTTTATVDAVYQELAGYESGSYGSLGSTAFAYGGASYSVSRLGVIKETLTASGFVFSDALRFKLAVLFPVASDARLVLELGTARFALSDASRRGNYTWKNHGLNWDENDSVEVKLSELQPPSAPRDLTADTKSPTQVDLAWDAPAASGGSDATGYRIEVSTDAGSTWSVLVADTNSTDTTYTDSSPTNSCSLRTYRVSAINVIGTGSVSDTVLAAVPRAGSSPEVAIIPSGHTALWSSTLTVGRDGYKLGYNADETYGTLSDDSFDYRGSTYTIDRLHGDPTVFSLGVGSGDLTTITNWTLLVGGKAFESTDGTAVGTTGRSWDAPAARPMCPGETVTVKLTTRRHAPERESPEGGKLWSAIMTTGQYNLGTGYDAEGLTVAGALSNDEFVYDGTTYYVTSVSRLHDGRLWVQLTDGSCCPPMLPPRTGLIVDGEPFAFADAISYDTILIWPNVRNWGVGKQVVVKIVSDINSPEHFPELLVQNAEVAESGTPGTTSTMTFHVVVDAAPDFPVGVHYETEDVTATGGASCAGSSPPDYISTEGRLTFGPGQTSKDVEVTVCDDTVMDSGETFRLVLRSTQLHEPISALGSIGPGGRDYKIDDCVENVDEDCNEETAHVSGTITNDEATTEVSIAADAAYLEEGADAAFTLRRTGEAEEALTVTVSVTVAEDGAAPGTASAVDVTFAAGSGEASLRAPSDDDGAAEADRTVTATVQAGDAWQLAEGAASASVMVLDNDAAAVTSTSTADVTVWSADMTVVEYGTGSIGAGTADLLANQSGRAGLTAKWLWYDPAARALKIAFDAGLDDAESMTLHVGGVSVRFPAGSGGDSSFTLADVDVSWTDGATLSARISKPSTTAVSTDATLASLAVPGARLSPAFDAGVLVYRAAVDAGVGTVTVQASATDGGATVSYGPAEDADGALADHQAATPAGETLVTVTVTAADGRTVRAYRVVVVRPPTVSVSFESGSYTATEGGDAASVIVALDADPGRDVTIPLTASPASGAAAEDYTVPGSVTFSGGGALSQDVVVTAVADDTVEAGERVMLGFGALPDGVEAGATTSAAVTLADTAPEAVNTEPSGSPAIAGTPEVGGTLTASVDGIEDGDGLDNATFAYQWLTDDAAVDGATGTTYEVTPGDVGRTLKVRVTFTDDGGTAETLDSAATEAVVAPLTASFEDVPDEHDGSSTFTFRVRFNLEPRVGYQVLRDESFAVIGGTVRKARRVDGRNDLREIHVEPEGVGDVTVTLPGGRACGTEGAICTADDKVLSNTETATVQGPPPLNVADARVEEGADATLDFVVTLSRAASGAVTVDYATADGSATAGADYTTASGTLTFASGTTEQRVSVPVLDDAVDDGGETLTLTLSNASGAWVEDGTATGTIENTDPLQRAWLARFGRTVGTHVTDAISDRLRGGSLESHLTIGGQRMPFGKQAVDQSQAATSGATDESGGSALLQGVVRLLGLNPAQHGSASDDSSDSRPRLNAPLGQSQTLHFDLRRILLGSSFRLALGADAADSSHPSLTAWGRFAGTQFDGHESDLSLDGDVLTGTVGIDGAWDRLLLGIAVAHSRGDGSFTGTGRADAATGDLKNTLTSFHPYLRYAVTDRLDVWGTVGYGWGELTVAQHGGSPLEADMNLLMGSFGSRGVLLTAEENGGFQLATRTDAMLTRTTSDDVVSEHGNLAGAEADAHRVRLILEGSRAFTLAEGRSFVPTMELGVRHDWGDAETGFGLELGGRVQYADPGLGLTIDGAVRALLAHEDDDYEEWGAWGTVRVDPGAGGQGLSLTLSPTWGAASSGVDGLWSRQTTAGLAPQGTRQALAGRLTAEAGYGVALFDRGVLTPYAGTVLSDGSDRTWRVGSRWRGGMGLEVTVEGVQQASAGQHPATGLRLQATWGAGSRGAMTLTLDGQRQPATDAQPGNQGFQLQVTCGF